MLQDKCYGSLTGSFTVEQKANCKDAICFLRLQDFDAKLRTNPDTAAAQQTPNGVRPLSSLTPHDGNAGYNYHSPDANHQCAAGNAVAPKTLLR